MRLTICLPKGLLPRLTDSGIFLLRRGQRTAWSTAQYPTINRAADRSDQSRRPTNIRSRERGRGRILGSRSSRRVRGGAEEIERQGAELTRRALFLQPTGIVEWPDGTATRYGFRHALYQQVLYERIPTGRRIALHQRIGERIEQGYDKQTREVATELALHFERGRTSARLSTICGKRARMQLGGVPTARR